jgi:hypothetical protein
LALPPYYWGLIGKAINTNLKVQTRLDQTWAKTHGITNIDCNKHYLDTNIVLIGNS